ncbi:hypothetical protein BLOT_016327, partial [Blomia tropicalis]
IVIFANLFINSVAVLTIGIEGFLILGKDTLIFLVKIISSIPYLGEMTLKSFNVITSDIEAKRVENLFLNVSSSIVPFTIEMAKMIK